MMKKDSCSYYYCCRSNKLFLCFSKVDILMTKCI
uniref:Uncharacterized protein n=1 Tax=Rhizophora mucronata TaxID=61149 RepID=A0A2P2PFM8_RHIMU